MTESITQGQILMAMLIIAGQIISIIVGIASMRRRPSLPEELYKDFVSRIACDARHCRESHTAEVFAATMQSRMDRGEAQFKEIERSLGHIEGSLHELQKRIP